MYRFVFLLTIILYAMACNTSKPNTSDIEKSSPPPPPPPPPTPPTTPTTTTSSFESAVFELTDDNFSEKMKKGEGLRMAYFTATWCGPCRVLGPTVDRVSSNYRGQVLMGKMDVDAHYSDAFNNITTVPTILFFKDGAEVFRTHGIVSEEYLTTVIERLR